MTRRDDLIDEGGPIVGPILLQDGYQDKVEFVDKSTLTFEALFSV